MPASRRPSTSPASRRDAGPRTGEACSAHPRRRSASGSPKWRACRPDSVGRTSRTRSTTATSRRGTATLHWIHLDPAYVGTGIGRALMAHALDDLRERGYRAVVLWVLEGNARARRFYEIGGWTPDGAHAERLFPAGGLDWPAVEVRYRREL
ncbi:MAG: GNAT family N-acetyltransferase [Dehalococcoidia bacterium]|nr:GNAT family N-acetyltransferase [Dehalococcoidia bacterium]